MRVSQLSLHDRATVPYVCSDEFICQSHRIKLRLHLSPSVLPLSPHSPSSDCLHRPYSKILDPTIRTIAESILQTVATMHTMFSSISRTIALSPNPQGEWFYDPPNFYGQEVRHNKV